MVDSRRIGAAIAAGTLAASLGGCVVPAPRPYAYAPVPPPRVEVVPPPPGPRLAWQRGGWEWIGNRYVWQPGHYVEQRPRAARWIPGHWSYRGPNPFWVPAHWA